MSDTKLTIPKSKPGDIPATKHQLAAVQVAFGNLGVLTFYQAQTVLSARDYARFCAGRLYGKNPCDDRKSFERVIASFMLADDDRIEDLNAWSKRRLTHHLEGSNIARTKRFREVEAWLDSYCA